MDFLHFGDFCDDDGARAVAFEDDAGCAHIFAYEGHELLALIEVGHFVGDGEVEVAVFRQDGDRGAGFYASLRALHAQVGGVSVEVLDGAGDVADQAFDRGLGFVGAGTFHGGFLRRNVHSFRRNGDL